jgi:hypothetical protein
MSTSLVLTGVAVTPDGVFVEPLPGDVAVEQHESMATDNAIPRRSNFLFILTPLERI